MLMLPPPPCEFHCQQRQDEAVSRRTNHQSPPTSGRLRVPHTTTKHQCRAGVSNLRHRVTHCSPANRQTSVAQLSNDQQVGVALSCDCIIRSGRPKPRRSPAGGSCRASTGSRRSRAVAESLHILRFESDLSTLHVAWFPPRTTGQSDSSRCNSADRPMVSGCQPWNRCVSGCLGHGTNRASFSCARRPQGDYLSWKGLPGPVAPSETAGRVRSGAS